MGKNHKLGYNERLFCGGFVRRKLHLARFEWLRKFSHQEGLETPVIVELGSFDGRSILYLPVAKMYVGLDARWETPDEFIDRDYVEHHVCSSPSDFEAHLRAIDYFVSLETIEHLSASDVKGYLKALSKSEFSAGFITVPNEIGPLFVLKQLVKRIFYGNEWDYTWGEFILQAIGAVHRVPRNQHKGFSYRVLARELGEYFQVEQMSVYGKWLPLFLSSQIGFIIRPLKVSK